MNGFLEHVLSVPDALRDGFSTLSAECCAAFSTEEIRQIKQIYLYGCGDSFNAAVCTADAFMQLAGIPTQPLVSLQASRYIAGVCVPQPASENLAIGISYSGEATRTLEATMALSQAGCRTMAFTAYPESRIGAAAWRVFKTTVPPAAHVPGTSSHAIALTALYLSAIHFSEVLGKTTSVEADALRAELQSYPDILDQVFQSCQIQAARFAEDCDRFHRVEFLASGPVRGSADFAAAKVIESAGFTATSQDVEEFAHLNFFFTPPDEIPTVLLVPSGARSLIRAREMELSLKHLGRPYYILTDGNDFFADDIHTIRIPERVREYFSPLLFSCIAAWMTAQIDQTSGGGYFRSHKGPFSEDGYPTIRQSKIVL